MLRMFKSSTALVASLSLLVPHGAAFAQENSPAMICADGSQSCVTSGEFGVWGPCTGGLIPSPEVCDYADNDCDGCADDGLCCAPPIDCSYDIGTAAPFVTKT